MSPEEVHAPIKYEPTPLAYIVQRDDGPYLVAIQGEAQINIPLNEMKLFQLLEQSAQAIRRFHVFAKPPAAYHADNSECKAKGGDIGEHRL